MRGPTRVLGRFRLDSLRYSTGRLERNLVLVGIPEVQLAFTGTSTRRQLAMRLWDVDGPTGHRRLISRISATSGRGADDGHAVRFEMSATAYEVAGGRSVELEISNLDLDWDAEKQDWRSLRVIPVFEPGDITVRSGGWLFSLLRLPEYQPAE